MKIVLNVTETDFRHYDSTLGRFNVMDPLAELAYDITPYRYGFNNPVYWSDSSGLFESWGDAYGYMKAHKLSGATIAYNANGNFWTVEHGNISIQKIGDQILKTYEIGGEMVMEISNGAGGGGSSDGSDKNKIQEAAIPIPLLLATGALQGMAIDLSIPDATDAIPYKWVAYAITATIAAVIVHSYGDDVVDYASGHFDSMGQRGHNNGKLEPEEEASLRQKQNDGTISKAEMQKLKKHLKNTGEKPTRKGKDEKDKKKKK